MDTTRKARLVRGLACACCALVLGVLALALAPQRADAATFSVKTMYRLYNPNSGEHFYTSNENEARSVEASGWTYEGIAWYAPVVSWTRVYRLYNPYVGDHHYTTDRGERDALMAVGWKSEGLGWYSDDAHGIPLYRQYNPNAVTGSHNYTASIDENNALVALGWRAEGIGWYGCVPPADATATE